MKLKPTGRSQLRKKRSSGWSASWLSVSSVFLFVNQTVDFPVPLFHAGVPPVQTIVSCGVLGRAVFFGGLNLFPVVLGFLFVLSLLVWRRMRIECKHDRNAGAQSDYESEPRRT